MSQKAKQNDYLVDTEAGGKLTSEGRNEKTESLKDLFLENLFEKLQKQHQQESPVPRRIRSQTVLRGKKKIAAGGLGVVYKYVDRRLEREIALKVARDQVVHSKSRLQRFLREREITAQLQHPAIPPVYQCGKLSDGRPYYQMRLINGTTFSSCIKEFYNESPSVQSPSNEPFDKMLRSFLEVCDAVQFAHENDVVHRDIKPANMMVEPDGTTFLLDWGLARRESNELENETSEEQIQDEQEVMGLALTRDGQQLGTPDWMSPEQAAGDTRQHSKLTDVYGLGATLFQIITGSAPHVSRDKDSSETLAEQLHRIVTEDPPEASDVNVTASPELASICRKAMSREPENRYESVTALKKDVIRWQRREFVEAHMSRYSPMQKLELFSARHRRLILMTVVTLVFMLGGAAWANVEVTKAADKTQHALDNQRRTNEQLLTSLERFSEVVMEDDILAVPQLKGLRDRLLKDLAAQYKLWSLQKDGTPEELSRAARGTMRLSQIERETGNLIRAIKSGSRAIELAEQSVKYSLPEKVLSHRLVLLEAIHSQAGMMLASGNLSRVNELIQHTSTVLKLVEKSLSSRQKYEQESKLKRLEMSVSYRQANQKKSTEERQKWFGKSQKNAHEAVKLQRKVLALNGNISQVIALVTALNAEALTLHKLARTKDAIVVYEEALDILDARKKEVRNPDQEKQLKQIRIMILFNAVMSYRTVEDFDKAREASKQGITICKELKQAYPLVIRYSQELARGYGNLAEVELVEYLKTMKPELLDAMAVTFRLTAEEYLSLFKQFPDRKEYQGAAAIQYLRLSKTLHWARRDKEALVEFRRCLKLNAHPEKLEPTHGANALAVVFGYCLLIHDEKPDDITNHPAVKSLPQVLIIARVLLESEETAYVDLFVQDQAVQRMKKISCIAKAITAAEETIKRRAKPKK